MSTRSLELWDQFAADSGEDTGFKRCGLLYLSDDEAQIAGWAKWREVAKTAGVIMRHAEWPRGLKRGQATGRAWEACLLPQRRYRRPCQGGAGRGSRAHETRRHCPPELRRTRHRDGGRPAQRAATEVVITTRTAVLAGGAWASSLGNQLGVQFPVATIRQSIVRLSPVEQQLPAALTSPRVAITRRPDGHYVLAISGRGRADPTAQLVRFAPQFIPMFAKRWRNVFPGGLEGMRWGYETRAKWKLDAPTPMERARILNPKPDPAGVREIHRRAVDSVACAARRQHRQHRAGYIDSTPDGVPGIGEVPQAPGSSWPRASRGTVSASVPARAT